MTRSPASDTSGFLWTESGESRIGPVASVVLVAPVDKSYTYSIPQSMESRIQLGHRIQVPVGKRGTLRIGYCIGIDHQPWTRSLRPIASLVDPVSYLNRPLIELGQWIARYYACPLGKTLDALVPSVVRRLKTTRSIRWVRITETGRRAIEDEPRLGLRQRTLLQLLDSNEAGSEASGLLKAASATSAVLNSLVKREWATIEPREMDVEGPRFDAPLAEPTFDLTDEQRQALSAIDPFLEAPRFSTFLLYGVTGSGKTEIYIRAARKVIASGRQVIMLVPEIMLTTQILQRLAARFEGMAVVHSGLSDRARALLWRDITQGSRPLIVGTRSAIFAPCPNPGLIIVDEEHDDSYKNQQAPRYHARDVAVVRARNLYIPILLGSATPSLESWHNAVASRERLPFTLPGNVKGQFARIPSRAREEADKPAQPVFNENDEHTNTSETLLPDFSSTRFALLHLAHRVQDWPMPTIQIVDMEDEAHEMGPQVILSRLFIRHLDSSVNQGRQAIVLINRRGYAVSLYCPNCHATQRCPNCDTSLTYHKESHTAWCHHCRYRLPDPERCPTVGCGTMLIRRGFGTQRIESHLKRQWPTVPITRVDSDTMRHPRDYQRAIDDFAAGQIRILVGTQMIAKGLDFPTVSFVGVLDAGIGSHAGDFRANERTFRLLTQVIGRAGRSHGESVVVIQTEQPDQPGLKHAVAGGFHEFAEAELRLRKELGYPPFCRMVRFVIADTDRRTAETAATDVAKRIAEFLVRSGPSNASVGRPMPCAIERRRNRYRYELVMKLPSTNDVAPVMAQLRASGVLRGSGVAPIIDVDPVDWG